MNIFLLTKKLVEKEKQYTIKILENLKSIERDKLYADLKYPSLHKYIIKELGYSEAEATIRVNAVRLMLKSKLADHKIKTGNISLTNASEANKAIKNIKNKSIVSNIIHKAQGSSIRDFKNFIQTEIKRERKEVLILDEHTLEQIDKIKEKRGEDFTSYEVIKSLIEKELKAPAATQRVRKITRPHSKSIPRSVKFKAYTGSCANCGITYNLEYDHIIKKSHGGTNHASNIQILCRSCNQRKEIRARQSNIFV